MPAFDEVLTVLAGHDGQFEARDLEVRLDHSQDREALTQRSQAGQFGAGAFEAVRAAVGLLDGPAIRRLRFV